MGVIVPVGDFVCTFVFNQANSVKDVTWSIGVSALWTDSALDLAQHAYDAYTFDGGLPADEAPGTVGNLSVAWTFVGVSAMEMTGTGPLVAQVFSPVTGTSSIPTIPMNCAYLAEKSTAAGGRKNRGRAYLPPAQGNESGVNGGGQIEAPLLVDLQAMYDVFWGEFVTVSCVPVLHHSDGSAGTAITAFTISNLVGTQRRRIR